MLITLNKAEFDARSSKQLKARKIWPRSSSRRAVLLEKGWTPPKVYKSQPLPAVLFESMSLTNCKEIEMMKVFNSLMKSLTLLDKSISLRCE